ncbi:MAG: cardiolipin synthase B [Coxiella sp. (in: Bacteria)]|nr:MAG: cardiolipin synthase B [Coxiella sp. (in: g-proteobacteria)]
MDHFTAMITDIGQATSYIMLETYIYQKDIIGEKIMGALCAAAHRGVTVRILVDGAGSPLWATNYASKLEAAGGEARIYHPFPWQLWNYSRSIIKLPFLLKWVYLLLKANKRNHRKVCIIDNSIAYIGSMNITKDHISNEAGGNNWRDTSVRVKYQNLDTLTHAFDNAWNHRTIPERINDIFRHIRHDPTFRLNYTWLRRRILYKNLLRRISKCRQRIWITNAYFVPDNFLLRRIKEAARRGIDVRILLPKKSDVFMMPWASSTFYYSLLKAGVRIFEYLPSNLHAKTLILDDWMLIGSSNLNHRSLLHDLEVDINVRKASSKKFLVDLFNTDLTQSKEISIKDLGAHRPWIHRFLGRLVLYMKYWI